MKVAPLLLIHPPPRRKTIRRLADAQKESPAGRTLHLWSSTTALQETFDPIPDPTAYLFFWQSGIYHQPAL